ncbi:hypothetical protein Efla_006323 [Eimeria flavescens]
MQKKMRAADDLSVVQQTNKQQVSGLEEEQDAVGDAQRGGAQESSIHEEDLNLSKPVAEGPHDGGCERHSRIPSHLTIMPLKAPRPLGPQKPLLPRSRAFRSEQTPKRAAPAAVPVAAAAAAAAEAAERRAFLGILQPHSNSSSSSSTGPCCCCCCSARIQVLPCMHGGPEDFALCMQRARKVEHQGQQRHIDEHSAVDAELQGTRGPGSQEGGAALAPLARWLWVQPPAETPKSMPRQGLPATLLLLQLLLLAQ